MFCLVASILRPACLPPAYKAPFTPPSILTCLPGLPTSSLLHHLHADSLGFFGYRHPFTYSSMLTHPPACASPRVCAGRQDAQGDARGDAGVRDGVCRLLGEPPRTGGGAGGGRGGGDVRAVCQKRWPWRVQGGCDLRWGSGLQAQASDNAKWGIRYQWGHRGQVAVQGVLLYWRRNCAWMTARRAALWRCSSIMLRAIRCTQHWPSGSHGPATVRVGSVSSGCAILVWPLG